MSIDDLSQQAAGKIIVKMRFLLLFCFPVGPDGSLYFIRPLMVQFTFETMLHFQWTFLTQYLTWYLFNIDPFLPFQELP